MFEQLSGAQERYQAINDRLMDPTLSATKSSMPS